MLGAFSKGVKLHYGQPTGKDERSWEPTLPSRIAPATVSQDGIAAGVLFNKLSRSTRNDRGNRRASKAATSPGAVLNQPMEILAPSGAAEKE